MSTTALIYSNFNENYMITKIDKNKYIIMQNFNSSCTNM